jgi:hypothetical protein
MHLLGDHSILHLDGAVVELCTYLLASEIHNDAVFPMSAFNKYAKISGNEAL